MPIALRAGPYALYFYSDEGTEPPHIHVRRDSARAKFWLDPVSLVRSRDFSDVELRRVERIVSEHQAILLEQWHEHFNK